MEKENSNKIKIAGIVILVIAVISILYFINLNNKDKITNFKECVDAGNPILESYPRQCKAGENTYTEVIDFEESLPELFRQKAIDKLGVIPVEGFDPELYKGAFNNLQNEDFNNTMAIGGRWILNGSELIFIKESQEITSADGTLTDEGILTLINSLKTRLRVELNNEGDMDNLVALISSPSPGGKLAAYSCSVESRNAEICTEEYAPVCGWSDPEKIQCIKYPCAQTYGNICNACKDSNVAYYTFGECPTEDSIMPK